MLTKIATKDMPREEWMALRRKSVGGSDAAAVLGLDAYRTPYALWCEKTGKTVPEDISDREAVRMGHDFEDYVARRWMEQTGRKARRDNHMLYNSDYPFAHANIDRTVVGENAGLECKTTSSPVVFALCRAGRYPARWRAQMMHYMMVTGAEKWYLAVLVLGRGFYIFEVLRDEREIEKLVQAERAFWKNVTDGTPPALDGRQGTQDALRQQFSKSAAGTFKDLSEIEPHLKAFVELKAKIKTEKDALFEHQAHIIRAMGTAETGQAGDYFVRFPSKKRQSFDRAAFEKDHGAIPAVYFPETEIRPLKVTLRKGL